MLVEVGADDTEWTEVVSGFGQQLGRAPGTVTVITASEIEKIGATTLEQVLQQVPGLHVSTTRGFRTVYAIRGIHSQNNSDVLVKINDVPVRDPFLGGRPIVFTMPVKNIRRIEVVRGAGSLVHGSDAIGGIINIITKTGGDMLVDPGRGDGYHARAYAGSFNTYGGALQYGGKSYSRGIDYALSIEAETTDGNNRRIRRDAQSAIDQLFGTSASHAPGRVRQDKTQFHIQGDLGLSGKLRIRGGFRAIENAGSGVGVFYTLSPDDQITSRMGNLDLEHHLDLFTGVELESLFSYQFRTVDLNLSGLPEGSPLFIQGMRQDTSNTNHQIIGKTLLMIDRFAQHRIQVGLGTIIDFLTDIHVRQNYLLGQFGTPIPLPKIMELRDIPGADDISRKRRRRFQFFALGQDEWNFRPDWFLTYGLRMDTYSDEETVISPRLALVHYLSPLWTGRLVYNRAFHMPSFVEQGFGFNGAEPDPEMIDLIELALEYKEPIVANSFGVSAYWYSLENMIVEVAPIAGSTGFSNLDLRGVGGEIWLRRHLLDNLSLKVSYSFQRAVEDRTDQVYGLAPNHMAFGELNWSFRPGWNLNTQFKWVGERKRAPGDTRKPLNAYGFLSLALRKQFLPQVTLTFTAQNLLDADAREPSNNALAMPGDVPLPGRSFLGIVDVAF